MIDWTIEADCRAYSDISGGPAKWQAKTAEPWLEIVTTRRIDNRWLRLTWRSGLYEPLCRIVVRCFIETKTGSRVQDLFLAAAPFGRGRFLFHVPAGTRRLLLSPVDRMGDFRFEVERVERLPIARVFIHAAGRSPGRTALAYCAFCIGRYRDMRFLLRDALAEIPLSDYAKWRRQGLRTANSDFDGPRPEARPRVRLVMESTDCTADEIVKAIVEIASDLAAEGTEGVDIVVPLRPDHLAALAEIPLTAICRPVATEAEIDVLTAGLVETDLIAAVPVGTRLQPNAVAMLRVAALAHPSADLIHGDDDCIDDRDPTIRPGFDPLLLQSFNYIGAAAVWRVGTARALAGNRQADDSVHSGNRANHRLPDPALAREGRSISRFLFRFPRKAAGVGSNAMSPSVITLKSQAEVDILIPTRDRLDLLKPCVDSILAKTEGSFRISILDNDSREPATLAYLHALGNDPRITVHKVPGPFNFSRICNEGVRHSSQTVLIFLNNDTTIIDTDWMMRLAAMAVQPGVGAVGAKLLYPDDRVQHAGIIAGLLGQTGHFESGMACNDPGFFGRATTPHHLSAVTGACLAVTRDRFLSVGGFDEENLPIDLNDIDLCFRLNERGYATVQLGDCQLYHHESASRGYSSAPDQLYQKERSYFRSTWMHILRADHCFSANLSLYTIRARLG